MRFSRKNYITASVLATAGLLCAVHIFHTPFIGIPALAVSIVLWTMFLAGRVGHTPAVPGLRSYADGLLLLTAAYVSVSTAVYVFWKLDATALSLLIVANGALQILFLKKTAPALPAIQSIYGVNLMQKETVIFLIGILALSATVLSLLASKSTAPLRSPWEVVPPHVLPLFALVTVAVVALAHSKKTKWPATLLACGTVAAGLLVAVLVYGIGYGFDPFIHEAALREILTHGVVLPKTPYYVGAYTLLVSLEHISGIALHTIQAFVGPLLGMVALADAGITAALLFGWGAPIAILLALLAPLGHFIQTTPQGIADAFALLAISGALRATNKQQRWLLPYTLAVASLATHPLAGIPTIGAILLLHVWAALRNSGTRLLATVGIATALLAFPTIAFLVQSPITTHFSLSDLRLRAWELVTAVLHMGTLSSFSPGRTLLYSARTLFPFLFLTVVVLVLMRRQATRAQRTLAVGATATACGGIFLALCLRLEDTPAYEQLIFPLRFVSLATLFLLPLFLEGSLSLIKKVAQQKTWLLFLTGILGLSLPATIYLAYPRIDPEDRSGGRSISSGTVDAVRIIHHEQPENAIVLANQTAAAAEIWQYGFSRYVNGEFYYSHPSGAPHLYTYYLEAVERGPSRELMHRAMDAYHADTVYFMLHAYWKNAPALRDQALTTADRTIDLSSEGVMIFVYNRR